MAEHASFFAVTAAHGLSYLVAAFLLAFLCVALFRKLAPWMGLLDEPGGRKQHERSVPMVGGLGVSVAVAVSSIVAEFDWTQHWQLALGACILLVTGIRDDRRIVRSGLKFAVQGGVALLVVFGEAAAIQQVSSMVFGHDPLWHLLAYAIAFFFVVGFINALNMNDGIDGLAGLLVMILSAALLLVAVNGIASLGDLFLLLLVIFGAVAGFLVFNFLLPFKAARYRVFLGDAGSMVLGLMIAWCTIHLAGTQAFDPVGPGVVAWIVAYPVIETIAVMTLRIVQGSHPFTPDRQHLHYLLLDRGLSLIATLFIISLLCCAGIGYAFLGNALGMTGVDLVLSIFVLMVVHFGLISWLAYGRWPLPRNVPQSRISPAESRKEAFLESR